MISAQSSRVSNAARYQDVESLGAVEGAVNVLRHVGEHFASIDDTHGAQTCQNK